MKVVNSKNNSLSIIGYCDIKPVVSRPDDDLGKLAATSAAVAAVGMSSSVAKNAPRLQRMLSVPCYKMLFLCRRTASAAAAAVADTAGWQLTEHLLPLEAPIAYLAGWAQSLLPSPKQLPLKIARRRPVGARIVSAASKTGQTPIGGERVCVVTDSRRVCLSARPRSVGSSRRLIVARSFVVLDTVSAGVGRRNSKRDRRRRTHGIGGQLTLIGASRPEVIVKK